jgi:transmembrane sensor
VDTEDVIAWKNGLFNFQGANISTVCRQLSRWYDVEIVYSGNIDVLFFAQIPRNTNLYKVLDLLERTGKVHFEIQGKKILVKP